LDISIKWRWQRRSAQDVGSWAVRETAMLATAGRQVGYSARLSYVQERIDKLPGMEHPVVTSVLPLTGDNLLEQSSKTRPTIEATYLTGFHRLSTIMSVIKGNSGWPARGEPNHIYG
jgi:hypothetical protein